MTNAVDRATDLLVQRTTEGLDPALEKELAALLATCPDLDPDSFELAAAAIELTTIDATEPLPASLRQQVLNQATAYADNADSSPRSTAAAPSMAPVDNVVSFERPAPTQTRSNAAAWMGWVAAAAIALAAVALWPQAEAVIAPAEFVTTPSERKAILIAQQTDLLTLDWATTEDPAAAQASGDVVWSNELQAGFMTFRGLPVNDPTVEQYQLWIFDAEQDEKYPVDGGVFDVTETGEVVIQIDPKLRIQQPTLFAITIEKPGGVVVSSRARLPLLAQVG